MRSRKPVMSQRSSRVRRTLAKWLAPQLFFLFLTIRQRRRESLYVADCESAGPLVLGIDSWPLPRVQRLLAKFFGLYVLTARTGPFDQLTGRFSSQPWIGS